MFKTILKYFKDSKKVERRITLRTSFGTPEENSKELLKLTALDFKGVRDRKDPEHLFIGRFLSLVLLVEAKLVQVLCKYESNVEDLTLGRKINSFKDFLRDLSEIDPDFEIDDYRIYIAPLKEIAKIRNDMAHDLSFIYFDLDRLPQTCGLMKKVRPDLFNHKDHLKDESDQALIVALTFGFQFSTQAAYLVQIQE